MSKEFFSKIQELISINAEFATATVIKTVGSASAKAGSKVILDSNGKIIYGWIGGGCAESEVSEQTILSLKDGKPRFINLNLDDEVEGIGMPCGGHMDVYIEPFNHKPDLFIIGHGSITESLCMLGKLMNFSVTVHDSLATSESFPDAAFIINDDPNLNKIKINSNSSVIIATQHKSDDKSLSKVIDKGAKYIGLIASKKRTEIVFNYLIEQGVSIDKLKNIKAPAGIDIGAVTPEEIALSIMSELIAKYKGGTYKPLMDIKGSYLLKKHKIPL
jgi:xanthine dehydrogenase accessory factor